MTARLVFSQVGRSFRTTDGPVEALRTISAEITPGSFTAIVGPSGCGKTTLLHIAASLDSGYTGRFERTPQDAVLAYMFQTPRLLPWLSARRNITLILGSAGYSRSQASARADELLAVVGLQGAGDRYPGQLSGGMQQRVALARALCLDPGLLLMDEPFSSLDELTAQRLRAQLLDMFGSRERTVLLVTHNIREACFLAERILVMRARPGQIVADLSVDVERPRTQEDPRLAALAQHVLDLIEGSDEESLDSSRG